MPDISNLNLITPPASLTDNIDRTGISMLQGSAYIKDLAAIRATELETNRLNDPVRLLAEQTKRDLDNRVLEEALEEDIRNNKLEAEFGRTDRIRAGRTEEAAIDSTIQGTRLNKKKADILEAYGMEDKRTEIEARRTTTAGTRESTRSSKVEERRRDRAEILKERELRIKEEERLDSISEQQQKQIEKEITSGGQGIRVNRLREAIKKGRAPGATEAEKDASILAEADLQGRIDAAQSDLGIVPPINRNDQRGEPQSLEEIRRDNLQEQEASLQTSVQEFDHIAQSNELTLANDEVRRQKDSAKRSTHVTQSAKELRAVFAEANNDDNNAVAKVGPIGKYAALIKNETNPDVRKSLAADLKTMLKAATPDGKIATLIEDARKGGGKPEELAATEKVLYDAAVQSGDKEMLTDEQQNNAAIISAVPNASPSKIAEILSDPVAYKENAKLLLQNNGADVKDPVIKRSLEQHPYMSAARKASKDGTRGFKVTKSDVAAEGDGGADLAGGEVKRMTVAQFSTGPDELPVYSDPPESDADWGMFSMLQELGKEIGTVEADNTAAAQGTQNIAQARQGAAQPRQVQEQQTDTTAPAANTPQAVAAQIDTQATRDVERLTQEFQARTGRLPTQSQQQAFFNTAKSKIIEKMRR